jgi:hypothetical protein
MYNPARLSQEEQRNRARSIHNASYLVILRIIDNIHDTHLLRVGNPRLYDHPYQSPQLALWTPSQVEWFVIIRAAPYGPRPRRKRAARIFVMQPPLLTDGTQG